MNDAGIDLVVKVSSLSEHWSPKVVARLNDYEIEVVKVDGQFVWHAHDDTDELFLVLRGELAIRLRDGNVTLRRGQLFVVPRGVERCPVADVEVHAIAHRARGRGQHRQRWWPCDRWVRRLTGIAHDMRQPSQRLLKACTAARRSSSCLGPVSAHFHQWRLAGLPTSPGFSSARVAGGFVP